MQGLGIDLIKGRGKMAGYSEDQRAEIEANLDDLASKLSNYIKDPESSEDKKHMAQWVLKYLNDNFEW